MPDKTWTIGQDRRVAPLLALLRTHQPVDPIEAQHQRTMIDLLEHANQPLDRDHWQPGHFTASSFVLSPDGQKLLLIFHGKLHRWLQPGGHVDADDADLQAAARREVQEETGLADLELLTPCPFDLDVHVIPARKGDPEHWHLDVRFLWQARQWAIAAGDDAQGCQWVTPEQVNALESDESVRRAVRKLMRMPQ